MGSGCYSTPGANNSCFQKLIPDTGVSYTGEAYPSLGICYGDKLNELEKIILDKLVEFASGQGITLSDVNISECSLLNDFISCCSQDKSLEGIITTVLKALCKLQEEIDDTNQALVDATTYTLDLGCLTVSNPTLQNVVNAIIINLCNVNSTIASLAAQVATLNTTVSNLQSGLNSQINTAINNALSSFATNFVNTNIKTCGNTNGISKSGGVATFEALVPPLCPIPYIGPLSNFDNSGAGIAAKGYCGWYICNGANNTPDMRGYAFSSATNVPGGSLDSRVSNPSYATSIGAKNGEYAHTLSVAELPAHQHVFNNGMFTLKSAFGGNTNTLVGVAGGTPPSAPDWSSSTGSTSNTGNGTAHENRQPTYYGCWIMRLS